MADDIIQELHDWAHVIDESQGKAIVNMLSGAIFHEAADVMEHFLQEARRG